MIPLFMYISYYALALGLFLYLLYFIFPNTDDINYRMCCAFWTEGVTASLYGSAGRGGIRQARINDLE